jgi:transcriptional regulator with XRE-family HTH domain
MNQGGFVRIAKSDHKVFVGRNLALARTALGKSQAALARDLGIASNKLNQWEAGLYYPDPFLLLQVCDDHGFTMDWFYRGVLAGVAEQRAADLRRVRSQRSEDSDDAKKPTPPPTGGSHEQEPKTETIGPDVGPNDATSGGCIVPLSA